MKGYKLVVNHDGDFYHERPYNIVLHDNDSKAKELIIEALRKVSETFDAEPREYLNHIGKTMSNFIKAYDSKQVAYEDEKYDIWFIRQGDMFKFEFDLNNGNQYIRIDEYEVELNITNDGVFINESKDYGYGGW